MQEGTADYRRSLRGRRQSWFGLKRHVKRLLAQPLVHRGVRVAARALPSLPVGRLPAPAGLAEVTGTAAGAEFVLVRPDRCEIAKELYWGRGRRPRPEDARALDLVVTLARETEVFLDVGAYTGVFSVASARANPALRGHAFEIVPAVAATLRENVERNRVADRVAVHEVGVGDPAETMRVPSGEGGSALPSFYSTRMSFRDGVLVEFVSLDGFADEHLDPGARVVMKIDVEGAEATAFRHGQRFLARHRPDILCEVLHGVADGDELTALVAPHGLRCYLVRDDDLLAAERIEPHPRWRDWLLTTRGAEELTALGIPVSTPAAPAGPSS